MNTVIDIQQVSRHFGSKLVLDDITLSQEKGTVLGLVGENGSGKTTIIKHILGLLKPTLGTVRVFGLNPVDDPVPVLARIGYMPEEDMLPGWMNIQQLQRYLQGFYPTWDQVYAEELMSGFGLTKSDRLASLSKGQRARAALMAALAYRPDLVLFDEPSSGLDPLVRRDILGAIVRMIADEGRTVLFSSHQLSEVDRVADRIAMVKQGRIVFCEDQDTLKATHWNLTVSFAEIRPVPPRIPGVIWSEGSGWEWTIIFRGSVEDSETAILGLNAEIVDRKWASLEEIIIAYSRPLQGQA